MERVEKIRNHPLYVANQKRIDELEINRIFCCHGVNHSLDVARILYILVLEQGLPYEKELIYATALLHDIGRGVEYEEQLSHHEMGAKLAKNILDDCDFSVEEISLITEAIAGHRTGEGCVGVNMADLVEFTGETNRMFCELFYQADKMSRNCFDCGASKECYWEQEKRNLQIRY